MFSQDDEAPHTITHGTLGGASSMGASNTLRIGEHDYC